mmetsp:Transcript_14101/g.34961  ORF Transcript_14101/g.34961 Transcript_14101/m.34961 type:complete len:324 (-) Transcript_14101:691-1662(-)
MPRREEPKPAPSEAKSSPHPWPLVVARGLWFDLGLVAAVQKDLPRDVGVVVLVALAPVVGAGVGEKMAAWIERRRGDRRINRRELLQPLAIVLVPESENTVAACCRECPVSGMEADRVYCVYLVVIPVALEGEVFVRHAEVGDATSSFDAAHCVPRFVREGRHAPCLHFQCCVPGPHRLRVLANLGEIVHQQLALGTTHDQHRVLQVHGVHPLRQIERRGGSLALACPEFDCFVPASADDHFHFLAPEDGLYWCVVLSDNLFLVVLQVPHLDLVVAAATEEDGAVFAEGDAEHRPVHCVLQHRVCRNLHLCANPLHLHVPHAN